MIELVVVIALLGILASIASFSIPSMTQASDDYLAKKELKTIEDAYLYSKTINPPEDAIDKVKDILPKNIDGTYIITELDSLYVINYIKKGSTYTLKDGRITIIRSGK